MIHTNELRTKIEILSKDKKDFVDAGRKTGDWAGVIDLLAHQYSDKTHFIFELLQNADDTNATSVIFSLYDDHLEFAHNGTRLFDYSDIESIVAIGKSTKKSNYTKIGKHGIGFKAVFAYTHRPKIFSEDIAFEIEDGIIPVLLNSSSISNKSSHKTHFFFPFDNENRIPPAHRFRELIPECQAKSEIEQRLKDLSLRALLFLSNIESIQWSIDGKLLGEIGRHWEWIKDSNAKKLKLFDSISSESWIVFSREIVIDADDSDKDDEGKFPSGTLKVAFLEKDGQIVPADNTELVVYFPTAVKTELGFLIHGPFKTTKARDNIKGLDSNHRHTDLANNQIINEIANLTADSLESLCRLDLMKISSYLALPIRERDFDEESFFRPIYNKVRDAFLNSALLPVECGGFIKARNAKLARVKDLARLFSPEQLGELFEAEKLFWLDSSITEKGVFEDFYDYLTDLVGSSVTPESLAPKLTAEFMEKQSIFWIIDFIQYIASGAKLLRKLPFIRLQSGEHVTLSDIPTKPTAWFAPAKTEALDLSAFPLVHAELAANETVRAFLEKEGIHEIDAADLVIESILPKYTGDIEFNYSDYLYDLQQIANAYAGNDETKQKLEEKLGPLEWLACVQAGNVSEDEIIWKQPKERDLFARPDELEITFSELDSSKIYFLHPLFEKEFEKHSSFKDYLSEKCVNDLSAEAIVERVILPKYKLGNRPFNEPEYRKDLLWLLKSPQAKGLKQIPWLACVHASGNKEDEVIWKRPNASESDKPYPHYYHNQEFERWRQESTIYRKNQDHDVWFSGLEDIDSYFLHPCVIAVLADDFINKNIKPIDTLVKKRNSDYKGHITITSNHGNHIRGLNNFDPDFEIIGLSTRINFELRVEHSLFIWNQLKSNYECIKGVIEKSNRQNFENPRREEKLSTVGNLLSNSHWLPDNSGNFHKPIELLLTDLPDEFENTSVGAREVAEKLGMKKPAAQRAIQVLAGDDPQKLSRLERFLSASEDEQEKMLKIIPKEIAPQPAPSFKNGLEQLTRPQHGKINRLESSTPTHPIGNPDRYQSKINTETEERIRQHERTPQTISFSVVRETSSNHSARHFLYEQYQGKCQITGFTFPKASANADGDAVNYFEACVLLSYSNADYLNNEGNMLSVSADTMAKFKHASFEWIDDLEATIEAFTKRTAGEIEDVKVKIRLAGEESEITWRERHFARLVALFQADNSIGENS